MAQQQMLRLPAIKAITGMARSTIYLYVENGLFPKPCRIGMRSIAWPSDEVTAIVNARISGQTDSEIKKLVISIQDSRKAEE